MAWRTCVKGTILLANLRNAFPAPVHNSLFWVETQYFASLRRTMRRKMLRLYGAPWDAIFCVYTADHETQNVASIRRTMGRNMLRLYGALWDAICCVYTADHETQYVASIRRTMRRKILRLYAINPSTTPKASVMVFTPLKWSTSRVFCCRISTSRRFPILARILENNPEL